MRYPRLRIRSTARRSRLRSPWFRCIACNQPHRHCRGIGTVRICKKRSNWGPLLLPCGHVPADGARLLRASLVGYSDQVHSLLRLRFFKNIFGSIPKNHETSTTRHRNVTWKCIQWRYKIYTNEVREFLQNGKWNGSKWQTRERGAGSTKRIKQIANRVEEK